MLEKLDQINWATIHHSHGTAEKFPRWIRQLTSSDKRIRCRAYRNIFEYSNHQGTIYEVTPFVTPFILELALNETTVNRGVLLYMLGAFAGSSSYIYLESIPEDPPEDMTPVFKNYYQMRTIYDMLWAAHPHFVKLLRHGKGNIRAGAAELLCSFWPEFEVIAPLVAAQIARERTDAIRSQMIDHFLVPLSDTERIPLAQRIVYQPFLESALQTEPKDYLKLQIALTLADLSQESMSNAVIFTLKTAMLYPSRFGYARTPESVVRRICNILCHLTTERFMPTLYSLLDEMTEGYAAHMVAVALLERAFYGANARLQGGIHSIMSASTPQPQITYRHEPANTPRRISDETLEERTAHQELRKRTRIYEPGSVLESTASLTELQHDILRRVLENDVIWTMQSNFLEMYGLPADREAARAFLDR